MCSNYNGQESGVLRKTRQYLNKDINKSLGLKNKILRTNPGNVARQYLNKGRPYQGYDTLHWSPLIRYIMIKAKKIKNY